MVNQTEEKRDMKLTPGEVLAIWMLNNQKLLTADVFDYLASEPPGEE